MSALSPFEQTLRRANALDLADDTLRGGRESSDVDVSSERRLPALVTVASVYAAHCAPSQPSVAESSCVARFTLLFFLVDDATIGSVPDLLAGAAPWSIGRYTGALRRWLGELPQLALAPAPLRESFARAYHDYLSARRAEHAHRSQSLDVDAHWAFRRRSIFMDPYLDLWLILRGVEPTAAADLDRAEARRLAIDLVLLANDLASAERDSAGGDSPDDLNLIHSYARQYRESEDASLQRLVALHNALVERYRASLDRARGARPGRDTELYVDVLNGVVQGNVASVLALDFRYPGAEPVMRQLSAVR